MSACGPKSESAVNGGLFRPQTHRPSAMLNRFRGSSQYPHSVVLMVWDAINCRAGPEYGILCPRHSLLNPFLKRCAQGEERASGTACRRSFPASRCPSRIPKLGTETMKIDAVLLGIGLERLTHFQNTSKSLFAPAMPSRAPARAG